MRIEFELSKNDYKNAYKEFSINGFRKLYWVYLLFLIIVLLIINGDKIDWFKLLVISPACLLLMILVSLIPSIYKVLTNNRLVNSNPRFIGKKVIEVTEKSLIINTIGFENGTEIFLYSIKKVVNLPNYLFVILIDKRSLLINKKDINIDQIIEFSNLLEKKNYAIQVNKTKSKKEPYLLGLLGIIPNLGAIIGVVLLILGIKKKDKKFIYIGIGDIAFTILFWIILVQFLSTSSDFRKSKIYATNYLLDELVKNIEHYKQKNGKYPDSLVVLTNENKHLFISEIFSDFKLFGEPKEVNFFYKNLGNDFLLKSYGPDKILNTQDDILPKRKR